jgi:peptidoglycan/xylan/chitin deacetylase (PgdA/CDA1 family)
VRRVTIVMYHYVRDLQRSRFPAIKGLRTKDFRGQLAYINRHYHVIRMEQLIEAVMSGNADALPSNALLLTFDDGYMDHFVNVMPLLDEYGIQGSFFPPARAITEGRVLDVNKIHFTLASVDDPRELVQAVFDELDRNRERLGLLPNDEYYGRLSRDSRYDAPDVAFVKRILQRDLPEDFRVEITDRLFQRYVTTDEAAFAGELYMGPDQLRYLLRAGMHLGSHGYDHYWLNTLPPDAQVREVDQSLRFLEGLGARTDRWVMCYPYGGYNQSLLEIERVRGCVVGLTTEVAVAELGRHGPLTLPRLDTNDLPMRDGTA